MSFIVSTQRLFVPALLFTALIALFLTAALAHAASAAEIDQEVDQALEAFRKIHGTKSFLGIAKGVLVFPKVYKAGIGVGGEYGEGALRVGGKTVDYYSTAAASFGFQLGAQAKSIVICSRRNPPSRNSVKAKAGKSGSTVRLPWWTSASARGSTPPTSRTR